MITPDAPKNRASLCACLGPSETIHIADNGLPADVRRRQVVIESAEVTPHPARDG